MPDDIAIKVENLGKMYRLGQVLHGNLRELSNHVLTAPYRWTKNLIHRNGTTQQEESEEDILWALNDVSFEVKRGEVLGVIGRNGAGKSTLLKILSRITEPTTGYAEIRGRVGCLLEVGTGFHPELTGRENIYLNGAMLGMSRKEINAKIADIIDFAEIGRFMNTPVKRYSSGMYTRLAFAVAAHLDPEVLIVDEVLAVGDAQFQKKCLGKMQDVAREGRTVLFVSHNMASVQRLCTRAILLESGKITLSDSPSAVVRTYLHPQTDAAAMDQHSDFSQFVRKKNLGEYLRIQSVRILGESGDDVSTIKYGQTLTLEIQVAATCTYESAALVVGIDAENQDRLATSESSDDGYLFKFEPDHPTVIQIRFESLRLMPGDYFLTLGIRSGVRGLDHLPSCRRFTVSEQAAPGTTPPSLRAGAFHLSPQWRVAQLVS